MDKQKVASELTKVAKLMMASSHRVQVMPTSDSALKKAEHYLKERFEVETISEIEIINDTIYVDTRGMVDAKTLGKELKKAGISAITSDFKIAPNLPKKMTSDEEYNLECVMDSVQPKGFTGTDVAWTVVLRAYENQYGKIGKTAKLMMATNDVIATNDSTYQWEDHYQHRVAEVYLNNDILTLVITGTVKDYGLGGGRETKGVLARASLGTLQKPRIGEVASLLKKHSFERSMAASPFKRVWTGVDGQQRPLSAIIEQERGFAKYAPPAEVLPNSSKSDNWQKIFDAKSKNISEITKELSDKQGELASVMPTGNLKEIQYLLGVINGISGRLQKEIAELGKLSEQASREIGKS